MQNFINNLRTVLLNNGFSSKPDGILFVILDRKNNPHNLNLYQQTLGEWTLSHSRASNVEIVVGIEKGTQKVISIFDVREIPMKYCGYITQKSNIMREFVCWLNITCPANSPVGKPGLQQFVQNTPTYDCNQPFLKQLIGTTLIRTKGWVTKYETI